MAHEQQKNVIERMLDKRAEWAAKQPSLGSEIRAMGREAVKDIRNSIHEVFFGKGEGLSEPGTPLSPTMQEVTMDRDVTGKFNALLDQYAARGSVHGREPEREGPER
jgi:hypothetical protein